MKGRSRRDEVLRTLKQSTLNRGRVPTQKEVLHELGMHRGTLTRILARLVEKGVLLKQPNGTLRYQFAAQNSRVEPSPASAEREMAAPARDSSAGAAASVDPHREYGWMA